MTVAQCGDAENLARLRQAHRRRTIAGYGETVPKSIAPIENRLQAGETHSKFVR